jgi:2-dehydropantoate 2-reductase
VNIGKIAVVGSGSVGLYYGGKLAHAGQDVSFLLRSGYEEARRDGIRIQSPKTGDVHLPAPSVFRSTDDIGPVDLVIIALKATANDLLPQIIPPLLHEKTALLTLQNGLGGDELLAHLFGAHRVLGGLCFVCLTRSSAASVDHIGVGTITIGEYQRPALPRTKAIAEALRIAHIKAHAVDDLAEARWRKLVWNIPFNGLSVTAGGVSTQQILENPKLQAECRALMDEVIQAANQLGHPIEKEYAGLQIERTYPMGRYRPSTLIDWEAGHQLEIEPIWGEPLRRAQAAGIPMPHVAELYEKLKMVNLA